MSAGVPVLPVYCQRAGNSSPVVEGLFFLVFLVLQQGESEELRAILNKASSKRHIQYQPSPSPDEPPLPTSDSVGEFYASFTTVSVIVQTQLQKQPSFEGSNVVLKELKSGSSNATLGCPLPCLRWHDATSNQRHDATGMTPVASCRWY